MRRSLLIRWKCKLGDEIEILIEIIFRYVAFERGWFDEAFERIGDDSTKMWVKLKIIYIEIIKYILCT